MPHLHRCLAMVFMLALCSTALAEEATYPIHLNRKAKAGEVCDAHIAAEDTQLTMVTAPNLPAPQTKRQSLKADLQARIETVEVDGKGNSALKKLTVKKFTETDTGLDLVEPGKTIQVK